MIAPETASKRHLASRHPAVGVLPVASRPDRVRDRRRPQDKFRKRRAQQCIRTSENAGYC